MGLFERITHKEEIQNLLDEAQQKYDSALSRLESQKRVTTRSLEKLGEIKLEAWSNSMDTFANAFGYFKNIEINRKIEMNLHFIGSNENPEQMLINMNQASMTASEIAKVGYAAIGTGALVGIASYGGAMMFASASTGTAIATLTGAAKTNATLAWFGGGSKAAGGLGIAGGKLVLAGIMIAPILLVTALITNAKSKEKLAEAKRINAEALEAVSKMDIVTTGMDGIAILSDNYTVFIKKMEKKFAPFIKELERLRKSYLSINDESIDYNLLTPVEQKTLHITWLMAQLFYHVLSTPILTDRGEASGKASEALSVSTRDLKQLRKDTFRMTGDETPIGNLFWGSTAKKMMIINYIAVFIYIICGIQTINSSIFMGISYFIGAVIAFPIFFIYKDLPASKLYLWRLVRLIISIVIILTVFLLIR